MITNRTSSGKPGELERGRQKAAWLVVIAGGLGLAVLMIFSPFRGSDELLNVSYDATREFFNETYEAYSQAHAGVSVQTSHAGSARQARNIIRGLKADIVTLATAADIDAIHRETGKVDRDWRSRFPYGSSPFTSTIVFLVRSGNPKDINDWDDLIRQDVAIVAPSAEVSGAGRWTYLAAWSYALHRNPGDEVLAQRFVSSIYARNPVMDQGARGALLAFLHEKQGDVLLTWESEALHAVEKYREEGLVVVYPSMSILAEPVVAVMDGTAEERGTSELAKKYLDYLFTPSGQDAAARHYLRPRDPEIAAKYAHQFQEMELVTIDDVFGGWDEAMEKHFSRGGIFDRIHEFEHLKRHSF